MVFSGLFLDPAAGRPLYRQLYSYLADRIRGGELPPGEKLPGKRTAAQVLGVSVNTVDQAYQMLAAEGYVEGRPRSGFVVSRAHWVHDAPPTRVAGREKTDKEAAGLPEAQPSGEGWRCSFASGDIDTALFPAKMWNRIFREVLANPALYDRGEAFGDEVLRRAICGYLRGYRGVHCTPEQVVVGAGLEVLTAMLARLLAQSRVALENPGYAKPAKVLRNEGVATCAVAVDGEGMRADLLWDSGADAAYITPSHQFPTGCVMPVGRRTELLQWAARREGLLIEDDYDSEFRFDGPPLPSLQGLDDKGRVVYAGTFSRSLAPGLRAAYLVLPPALLERWRRHYAEYACTISRPEQHTLARFMAEGHFARSLNRMRLAYRKKRDELIAALADALPLGGYSLLNVHTGHYLLLRLPHGAMAAAEAARQAGIRVRALDEYYVDVAGEDRDLLLGYGGFAMEEIRPAVGLLAALLAREGLV